MKLDLPCEIVRDLLPNYVDGLTSDSSTASVEAHLKQCDSCKAVYETMKKDYQTPSKRIQEITAESEQEKTLFRKINKKMNAKVRKSIWAGGIGIVLVAVLCYGLFNVAVKEVPIKDVQIVAHVYDIDDIIDTEGKKISMDTESSDAMSVVISKEENPDQLVTVQIPDHPAMHFTISSAVADDCPYVSVITFYAPYHLRNIDWEYVTIDGKRTMCITTMRTTLLGNRFNGINAGTVTLEFSKIDQIVYVTKDGEQITMWENDEA